jgi:hypothetical protein
MFGSFLVLETDLVVKFFIEERFQIDVLCEGIIAESFDTVYYQALQLKTSIDN